MSMDDLKAFFGRLQEDAALRDRVPALQDAEGAGRVGGLLRLAREHGFDVTREDLTHAASDPSAAELDDESLSGVAGTGPCDSSRLGGSLDPVPMGF
jgi:predicted ribosomally synthesized peptide with nif11-like leader